MSYIEITNNDLCVMFVNTEFILECTVGPAIGVLVFFCVLALYSRHARSRARTVLTTTTETIQTTREHVTRLLGLLLQPRSLLCCPVNLCANG